VLEYGLEVWRPNDALRAYIPRWNAQEEEFARRHVAASGAALISGHSNRRGMDHAPAGPRTVVLCEPRSRLHAECVDFRSLSARALNLGVDKGAHTRGTLEIVQAEPNDPSLPSEATGRNPRQWFSPI
jgi:hypothetical protein